MENVAVKESLAVFLTSQGVEVRANLLRFTRYLVVLEIYNQTCVLQTSEVLSGFKLILNDRTLYSGRGVVRNLMNTGLVTVCEVTLDDSWLDVDFSSPAGMSATLGSQFQDFIQEWQKLYRVNPEYKVVIADLQTFLTDLRLWLEQVELGIRSSPSGDRTQLEREIIEQLQGSVVPAINNLFERYEVVSDRIEPDLVPAHRMFGKRQLHPLLLCSPFVYRTYHKPLGYAGDYEMVNMMFREPFEGGSLFAKMVNIYSLQLAPITAHRNRIAYLLDRLIEETRRLAARNRPIRVFNLGCGPAQEVQRFMARESLSNQAHFTLADLNEETLAHVSGVLNEVKRRYGRSTTIQAVKRSVHQLLKQADRTVQYPNGESYDVIYCAGLFDYLSDKVCRKLTEIFYDMLAPGGLLIVTNVDAHPARNEMECFLEWHLIHRNNEQMLALAPRKAVRDTVALKRDMTGVNILMEVRKPDGEDNLPINAQVLETYADYERQITIKHLEIGSYLVMLLMPVGVVLDYFVYPDKVGYFLGLRLICALSAGVIWALLRHPISQRIYRVLSVAIALLPAFFICCMIYSTEGFDSPYYAGLNLVLLCVALIMRWSVDLSVAASLLTMAMYLAACFLHGSVTSAQYGAMVNNLYFLVLSSGVVVAGGRLHQALRMREFALRYELDKNRKALEESNQKLVELDQIKSRFFANISHELRTPLTLLLAPLESLLHRYNRSFDEETRDLLFTMHSNGMRLLKLINDLLDLVRLESGRMEVKHEPLEVAEFVKGLASAARQVADDKRLKLETFVDPQLGAVLADRDKLEKIVLNLVFNALKFTPAGGRVELRAEKQAEEFVLIVADTGMGISEKNLPFVFDRFWQADGSSKRKYQGVGIGLALVKELAQIQGGDVTVQSQEGRGTTFTVRVPYQPAEPAHKPKPAEIPEAVPADGMPAGTVSSEEWLANLYRRAELFPALTPLQQSLKPVETTGNGKHPTILVADDEPDMLRFLKSQLSPHYQVLEAVDGQQAIEKASQFLPDIILLDMMMPEKDGMQACREIRERTPTQSIPVILLTARADEETKLAALEAGASDFLAKPFSTTELHVRIKNLVESHQYQRKVAKQNQALESTIEQLKDTETQLVQSEKLASLGRMSAGIIHEINNPLNYATTGLFTLRSKGKYLAPEQKEEYEEVLKDVEEGIKRVKNIVSDLRMFTHPDTEQRDQVEVSEVVTSALRFLSNEWKDKVCIEQKLTGRQTIWSNKNKLIHVMVNLLQNSLDALRRKTFDGEKPTIWIEGRVENGSSLLVVRDNGMGIDAKDLDKIFDPFFTTKDVGEGMGLGLSICYRIVQEYEGRVSVKTERGKFCEFTLEFPAKG